MSKTETASTIRAKIANLIAGRAKTEEEIAELERAAKWAEGQARCDRLTAVGVQAAELADGAGEVATAIEAALAAITAAVQTVHQLADGYNTSVAVLQRKLADDGVAQLQVGYGCVPPSPADGGVAPTGGGILVGDRRIHTASPNDLVTKAVRAGQSTEATATADLRLTSEVPPLDARYWRVPSNGRVLAADHQMGADLVEITKAEYLAAMWRLDLRDLPDDVLAELTDVDRARLAPTFLAELDDSAKAEFAKHLVPGSGNAA